MKNGLTCSKNVLYSARRSELKEQREHEMGLLIDEIKKWRNWNNIILADETGKFTDCYVYHNPIINCNYSTDYALLMIYKLYKFLWITFICYDC